MIAGIFGNELRISIDTGLSRYELEQLIKGPLQARIETAPAGNGVLIIERLNESD